MIGQSKQRPKKWGLKPVNRREITAKTAYIRKNKKRNHAVAAQCMLNSSRYFS